MPLIHHILSQPHLAREFAVRLSHARAEESLYFVRHVRHVRAAHAASASGRGVVAWDPHLAHADAHILIRAFLLPGVSPLEVNVPMTYVRRVHLGFRRRHLALQLQSSSSHQKSPCSPSANANTCCSTYGSAARRAEVYDLALSAFLEANPELAARLAMDGGLDFLARAQYSLNGAAASDVVSSTPGGSGVAGDTLSIVSGSATAATTSSADSVDTNEDGVLALSGPRQYWSLFDEVERHVAELLTPLVKKFLMEKGHTQLPATLQTANALALASHSIGLSATSIGVTPAAGSSTSSSPSTAATSASSSSSSFSRTRAAAGAPIDPSAIKRVVVIGGGLCGSLVCRLLDPYPNLLVTLIDPKPYFSYTPGLVRALTDPHVLDSATLPHAAYLRRGHVILGHVDHVGLSAVELQSGEHVPYDYCVVATGTVHPASPQTSTLATTYRPRKLARDHAQLAQARSVLIVGGGALGVEMAAEMATTYGTAKYTASPDALAYQKHLMPAGSGAVVVSPKRITLVDANPRLLRRCPVKAHEKAAGYLRDVLGVEVVLGERLVFHDPARRSFRARSGREFSADVVYLATGPVAQTSCMEREFGEYLVAARGALGSGGEVKATVDRLQVMTMASSESSGGGNRTQAGGGARKDSSLATSRSPTNTRASHDSSGRKSASSNSATPNHMSGSLQALAAQIVDSPPATAALFGTSTSASTASSSTHNSAAAPGASGGARLQLDSALDANPAGFLPPGATADAAAMAAVASAWSRAGRRVRVSATHQIPGHPRVFAGGDCSATDEEKLALTAQCAAVTIARNIVRMEAGKRPIARGEKGTKPIVDAVGMRVVALGNGNALGIVEGRVFLAPSYLRFKWDELMVAYLGYLKSEPSVGMPRALQVLWGQPPPPPPPPPSPAVVSGPVRPGTPQQHDGASGATVSKSSRFASLWSRSSRRSNASPVAASGGSSAPSSPLVTTHKLMHQESMAYMSPASSSTTRSSSLAASTAPSEELRSVQPDSSSLPDSAVSSPSMSSSSSGPPLFASQRAGVMHQQPNDALSGKSATPSSTNADWERQLMMAAPVLMTGQASLLVHPSRPSSSLSPSPASADPTTQFPAPQLSLTVDDDDDNDCVPLLVHAPAITMSSTGKPSPSVNSLVGAPSRLGPAMPKSDSALSISPPPLAAAAVESDR